MADSRTVRQTVGRGLQLAIGIVCMVMIANLQYGWTLFVTPIDQKYHWGRPAIQVAFSIFVLTETWLVPIEGWFVDRFGPKIVVMIGGILVGIAWGAVYAQWVEPRLHLVDWLSGLCFALLPLCVALVIVLPVLDGAATDLGPLGPLAATSEALRHGFFGAALGAVYPLRLARLPAALRRNTRVGLVPSPGAVTS